MTSDSENDDDGDDRLDAMLREADLLASQMRRMNGEGLDDDDSPTAEETDRTVEEMLRGAEFLISQMDPGSGGSSLSASQNPSRHSVTDVDLDEMLKKAEHLATKMTTKASESEIRDHAAVRKVDPPNAQEHDDVLGQAQLLASKMRNFQNSLVQGGDDDDEEFVVDEMLVRAGILAQSMQCTSIADEKYDVPDTHSLIGRSEALLVRVNWRDKSPNHLDDTPELIRQTDLLLSQMSHHIRDDCSIKSTDSPVDDMIRQTQVLLDQFHDAASPMQLSEKNGDDILAGDAIETSRQGFSRPPRAPRAPRPPGTPSMLNRPSPVTPSPRTKDAQESNDRAAQEEQMTQLIQDTLTALATVNGQSDLATVLRGNAALMEQAMASLQNAKKNATKPDPPERLTPTLVSIRPYGEDSEVSSVGSGSARSLPLLGRATSFDLTSPPICKGAKQVLIGNPDSVDAAVELSKQMAAALEETFSQSSDLAENREEPPTIPELDHELDEASLRKLEEQRKWEQTLQDEEVAVIADFSKQREGQTKSIRFEKVVNAADGDDDYVPLVDYTKLGRGTPLRPSVKSNRRSPASKRIRRRKEIIRFVASFLGLILVRFTWLWLQRQMGEGVGEQGLSLLAENAIGPLHDVAPSTNGMEGRIADDGAESISDVPDIADVNTDNDDVNSDNEDVSVYADEDRWDEDDIDNELEAFGADETEFGESESQSVYEEEFESRVDISISADQDAVEIDAIDDFLDDDEFEENEESYVDYGEKEYYDELFDEETERIEVNNDQEVYSAAFAESTSDAPVIFNVAAPVDSITSNDQFKYAERMIVSYTSDAVETTLYDDPIPKGCLVPFSYLVSKDCRTIANHRPLVDVHGIVDTMLQ